MPWTRILTTIYIVGMRRGQTLTALKRLHGIPGAIIGVAIGVLFVPKNFAAEDGNADER